MLSDPQADLRAPTLARAVYDVMIPRGAIIRLPLRSVAHVSLVDSGTRTLVRRHPPTRGLGVALEHDSTLLLKKSCCEHK